MTNIPAPVGQISLGISFDRREGIKIREQL
jgi:hypothetical protein